MTGVAVVGHVEWVDFVSVERLPREGEVLHALGAFARAAGGGGVAAGVLAGLGAQPLFFCALGRDAHGEAALAQLREHGVEAHVAWREQPTRRAITLLEPGGERTIITIGERLEPEGKDDLPWELLEGADAVYFTAGDKGAVERCAAAGALVASPRGREALYGDGPELDALVLSAHDQVEIDAAAAIAARARWVVVTDGERGGRWSGESSGTWEALPLSGPPRDSYGCGDSFAAGFTLARAQGRGVADAVQLGAACGARCLTRAGAP